MTIKKATIVVPVYGDWNSLAECIESLKKCIDTKKDEVLLVNDCGPDADLIEKNIKKSISGQSGFSYIRNKKNLGFVGTCNLAVSDLDKTNNDILLLNSDTKVTPGFLEEMKSVLYSQKNIGTVSPRTNNATICTIPLAAISQKGIGAEESYNLFLKYNKKFPRFNSAPTAHGFCMLIRRSLIEKHGLFDPVFGKGYGEEVDFCQRIQKKGWLSAICNHAFVFHQEARSFSLEAKAKLLETNNKIIRSRYPEYQQAVKDYIDDAMTKEAIILGGKASKKKGKLRKLIKRNDKLHALAKAINKSVKRTKSRRS
jgi:GT2 family glycosyltransferase